MSRSFEISMIISVGFVLITGCQSYPPVTEIPDYGVDHPSGWIRNISDSNFASLPVEAVETVEIDKGVWRYRVSGRGRTKLSSVGSSTAYIPNTMFIEQQASQVVFLIKPNFDGTIAFRRDRVENMARRSDPIGGFIDLMIGPKREKVNHVLVKPEIATIEVSIADGYTIVHLPDNLAPGEYVLTDLKRYAPFAISEDSTKTENRAYLGAAGRWSEGTYLSIDTGGAHTCGVTVENKIVCWGRNWYKETEPPIDTFLQVGCGDQNSCGLREDGSVLCWGGYTKGWFQIPSDKFSQISVGGYFACGLKSSDGSVVCWAQRGRAIDRLLPPTGVFLQLSSGTYHACGIREGGSVECWGGVNEHGEASPPAGAFLQVSAAASHTCGIKEDGTLTCWGRKGDLLKVPTGRFVQVSTASNGSCAVATDGSVYCWGLTGTHSVVRDMRLDGGRYPPPGSFVAVSAGDGHSCGIKANGYVVCWGENKWGESTPQ